MSDELKQLFSNESLNKFRQWHFWWLVVFSLLLTITFVYYLPTRFLNQVAQEEAAHEEEEEEETPHGHEEGGGMMDEEMIEHMDEHANNRGMNMNEMVDQHGNDESSEDEHQAFYSEETAVKEGLAVNLNVNPVPYNVGVPLSLSFFVNQKPGNLPVPADQLQVEHEKLMHVIGVRSDMNEFFHIHPEIAPQQESNPGYLVVDYAFNKPGLYKIWSGIKKDGIGYVFGHPEINIGGLGIRENKQVSFSRNVITGDYQVSMEISDMTVKGQEVDLSFDIHTLTGMEVEVEKYFGADMHLVLIKDDLSRFIHAHSEEIGNGHSRVPRVINTVLAHGGVENEPAGTTNKHQTVSSSDEVRTLHVTFPESGLYKAFAQFRPKGISLPSDEALLVEFWIQVEEKAPFPVSQWWGLLIVSAVLIVGLSWAVSKYLKVKAEDITVKK